MVQISTDNNLIYALLEKSGQLQKDFHSDKVIAFDNEDDFCIVIYSSNSRNFFCFKAQNYLQENDALIHLLDAIQDYSFTDISSFLIDDALQIIENKLLTKNNSKFYFDAH